MNVWVWKRISFDAAHQLPDYPGACANVHGHTYYVELGLFAPIDPESGMAIDMKDIGEFLEVNVKGLYDHQFINEKMRGKPSTAEMIGKYVFETAQAYFVKGGKALDVKVRVYETPDSWVELVAFHMSPVLSPEK